MLKRFLLPFLVVCAFVMVGCSKTESNENMSAGNSNNSNKSATSANTSSGTTGTSSTASSSEKIGIADCDDFIAKYDGLCFQQGPGSGTCPIQVRDCAVARELEESC